MLFENVLLFDVDNQLNVVGVYEHNFLPHHQSNHNILFGQYTESSIFDLH